MTNGDSDLTYRGIALTPQNVTVTISFSDEATTSRKVMFLCHGFDAKEKI
jgi:hypothetical protein